MSSSRSKEHYIKWEKEECFFKPMHDSGFSHINDFRNQYLNNTEKGLSQERLESLVKLVDRATRILERSSDIHAKNALRVLKEQDQ